jgi:hypothetical protein
LAQALLAALQAIYGIASQIREPCGRPHPNILPAALAWAVYALTLIRVATTIATPGRTDARLAVLHIPDPASPASWHSTSSPSLVTATSGATRRRHPPDRTSRRPALRRSRELLAVASILGMTLLVAVLLTTKLTPGNIPADPAPRDGRDAGGVRRLRRATSFRRIVQLELDRVLVQSAFLRRVSPSECSLPRTRTARPGRQKSFVRTGV